MSERRDAFLLTRQLSCMNRQSLSQTWLWNRGLMALLIINLHAFDVIVVQRCLNQSPSMLTLIILNISAGLLI